MKNSVLLLGLAFALFSCNSGNKKLSTTVSDEKKASSGETYDCLKPYQDEYDKLLTEEDMADVYLFDFDAAEVELTSGSYGNLRYSWPSDRPELEFEVSGMKMKGADDNFIEVSKLSFYSGDGDLQSHRDYFDMGFKELSDEELKAIDENLSKQSDEVQKTGKDMMKVRAKRIFEFVDGTGSSAWYKWDETYGGELVVLAGKATFYINVKISDDPKENREIAEKLAEKVLAKCG
ncbi:MAG: hypothetical protein WBA61_08570 [Aequorivita sp.]